MPAALVVDNDHSGRAFLRALLKRAADALIGPAARKSSSTRCELEFT